MFTIILMITIQREKKKIVFDDIIADIITNKKFQLIILIRCKKLNKSLLFITESYFFVPKEVRLNCIQYLLRKIQNKKS